MKNWSQFIRSEQEKDYFKQLLGFLESEMAAGRTIYPPQDKTFAAFDLCPLDKLKVVILGQDPYHGEHQAMGLAFSVPGSAAIPPSLRNIRKELAADIGSTSNLENGDLTPWAKQGVFLLNTLLSVEANKPLAHAKQGWEIFTDATIEFISKQLEHVVFLLWGNPAKSKLPLIDTSKHCVLTAAHPSPLSASRGFLGCQHFSKANQQLIQWNFEPIRW